MAAGAWDFPNALWLLFPFLFIVVVYFVIFFEHMVRDNAPCTI